MWTFGPIGRQPKGVKLIVGNMSMKDGGVWIRWWWGAGWTAECYAGACVMYLCTSCKTTQLVVN